MIAHLGSLSQIDSSDSNRTDKSSSPYTSSSSPIHSTNTLYVVTISIPTAEIHQDCDTYHHLVQTSMYHPTRQDYNILFSQEQYEYMSRLFCILDTENQGTLDWKTIFDFVILRCPLFRKRDATSSSTSSYSMTSLYGDPMMMIQPPSSTSPTFNEIWILTLHCSKNTITPHHSHSNIQLGIEGWMIFSRFILIAQLLERKRSFSGRHLQQTMQHKREGKSSEVVLVQVPPPDPPSPLYYQTLIELEWYDLPTMEMDFSFFQDLYLDRENLPIRPESFQGVVDISEFRPCASTSSSHKGKVLDYRDSDFVLSFYPHSMKYSSSHQSLGGTKVKRSLQDFIWIHETFLYHKVPGDILWGRIIPPFPIDWDTIQRDDDSSSGTQPSHRIHFTAMDTAISVATTGVGVFSGLAKSAKSLLFGGGSTTSNTSSKFRSTSWLSTSSRSKSPNNAWREDDSCIPQAFERYFNYILESPVLSLSFAMHVLLKASGAGLDSAKRLMLNQRQRPKPRVTPELDESNDDVVSSSASQKTITSTTTKRARQSWVRTAAQAALSIHIHAILESTGHSTASVKLQHASLPYIASSKGRHDDDCEFQSHLPSSGNRIANLVNEFESGVICVESELDVDEWGDIVQMSGYDLLPSPLPPSERSALCAGKNTRPSTLTIQDDCGFLYGEFECSKNPDDSSLSCPPTLGDVSLDSDIDRLRDIIYGLRNDLEKCLTSLVAFDDATRRRADLHLRMLTILDNWEGMRGQIISQKALLNGASSFNTSFEGYVTITEKIIHDVSWQASLASSAVTAANEVRCTFQASQTAASAKEAADLAYKRATESLDTINETEDSEAAQARVAILKQQAIHSAIVEYEALSAKHKSSTALAHDVRTWNNHRKREVFSACLDIVTSQQKSAHHFAQSWEQLRDGLINTSPLPTTHLCTSQSNSSSPTSHAFPSFTNENTQSAISFNTQTNKNKFDPSLQELMLADKNNLYPDTSDPFAYCTTPVGEMSLSSSEVLGNNSFSFHLDGIASCESLPIGNNYNIENMGRTESDQVLDENEGTLSFVNSTGKLPDDEIQDTDEILDFRSLSFDDVDPQPLFVNNSDEEDLIYAFLQNAQDMKSHLHESISVNDNLQNVPFPGDLLDENEPVDITTTMGTLTRMNSMDSLINGLMTWAPNDVEESTSLLDTIG